MSEEELQAQQLAEVRARVARLRWEVRQLEAEEVRLRLRIYTLRESARAMAAALSAEDARGWRDA